MNGNVHTYHHPQKWEEHKEFSNINQEIHICATKNMMEGIKDRYRNDEQEEFQYIFTIHQVISSVFSKWNAPETILQQYLTLSRVISKSVGEENLKDAFRNNTTDLLDTIRFLAFCGVKPDSLISASEKTEKEVFFQTVWENLEDKDESYETIRKQLTWRWKKETFINRMNGMLKRRYTNKEDIYLEMPTDQQKIILHGFYFITPEQQVFLKFLERAGFKLIFFQYYDERFPTTFDFSRAFISNRYGWKDEWDYQGRDIQASETAGYRFLQSFEKGFSQKPYVDKKIMAYESFFDFLHEVIMEHHPIGEASKEQSDDAQIIATNADILNEMLVQYYPEKFANRRNFLNYPVGQFILKVHQILDGNTFILNTDILMSTFSSGWLYDSDTKQNARDYTNQLQQLFPFFTGCKTMGEWIERIDELLDQYETILPLFESEKDNRVMESIRSPFAKIAHLALGKEQVNQIRTFFVLLEEMANELFDISNGETSIHEHFQRLAHLMKEHNPTQHTLMQSEEKELIIKLNNKISSIEETSHQFLYEDIGKAIQFYLSGNFSKDNEEAFIKPFIEVDGEAFKKNRRKVYLTGLDEQGLPLSEFSIPWPLQEETFTKLSEKHRVLELNELRNRSVKAISRYLLFITLEFLWDGDLNLSWMRNFLDRENLQPAVYVHYLNMEIENHSFDVKTEDRKDQPFDFSDCLPGEDTLIEVTEDLKYEDILAEYQLCPRRFYFGYVLDRFPTFSDEFIHQFIFSEIIKVTKRTTKQDNESVIKMVSDLFPQWTTYKKENMAKASIGFAGNRQERKEVIDGNVSVSETRKNFQFPGLTNKDRQDIYQSVRSDKEKLMEAIQYPDAESSIIMKANSGYNCRYCPFLDLCYEGKYAVDEKKKKKR